MFKMHLCTLNSLHNFNKLDFQATTVIKYETITLKSLADAPLELTIACCLQSVNAISRTTDREFYRNYCT